MNFNFNKVWTKYFSIAKYPGVIPVLDGFRGIAILLVLLRHAARPIFDEHGTILLIGGWELAVPFLNGWMGVDLFFVLSGFLITHHLLKNWPDRFNWRFVRIYWLKRILRTFPAYYTSVLVVAFSVLPFYQPEISDFGYTIFNHLFFLQDYRGSELVSAFWSLGVEEKFYILCPFVLLWLKRYPQQRQLNILIALALLPMCLRLATLYANQDIVTTYPDFFWIVRAPAHTAFDGLWIGVICSLIYRWRLFDSTARHRLSLVVLLTISLTAICFCLFSFAWFDKEFFWTSTVVIAVVPIAFGCIILVVILSDSSINRFLKCRILRFLAVTSYSIYLTHLMVVPLALGVVSFLFDFSVLSPIVQFIVFLPVFFMFSILGGGVLHFLIEKPFLIIKDRIRF